MDPKTGVPGGDGRAKRGGANFALAEVWTCKNLSHTRVLRIKRCVISRKPRGDDGVEDPDLELSRLWMWGFEMRFRLHFLVRSLELTIGNCGFELPYQCFRARQVR